MSSELTVGNITQSDNVKIPVADVDPAVSVAGSVAFNGGGLKVYDGTRWKSWSESFAYVKEGLVRNIDWSKTGNSNEIQANIQTLPIGGGGTYIDTIAAFGYQEFAGNQALVINDKTPTNYVTVDILYKATSLPSGNESIIWNKENCWELKNSTSGLQWAFYSSTQAWFWSPAGFSVNNGEWNHIVVTFDGTAVRTFKNGVLGVAYTSGYGNSVLANQDTCWPKINARTCDTTSAGSSGAGGFAYFRVYNRALNQAEITKNYEYCRGVYGI
jgi:hypothetical protein